MSRIILSKYPGGRHRVVVGWDHPLGGCFWSLYGSTAEMFAAAEWLEKHADDYHADSEEVNQMIDLAEIGLKDNGWPPIPLHKLRESMPAEIRPLLTTEIKDLLAKHADDPNSSDIVLDWSYREQA